MPSKRTFQRPTTPLTNYRDYSCKNKHNWTSDVGYEQCPECGTDNILWSDFLTIKQLKERGKVHSFKKFYGTRREGFGPLVPKKRKPLKEMEDNQIRIQKFVTIENRVKDLLRGMTLTTNEANELIDNIKQEINEVTIFSELSKAIEKVNHPNHYGGDITHEVYKCLEAWKLDTDAYLWQTVKYIARAGKKPGESVLEDLKKAQWYLSRRITILEEGEKK